MKSNALVCRRRMATSMRWLGRVGGVLVVGLLLAGCTMFGEGESTESRFADGDEEAMFACLRNIGFPEEAITDWPDVEHPAWVDERWIDPAHICLEDAGLGEVRGDDPEEIAARNAKMTGLVECIEQRGWELPEPAMDDDGSLIPWIGYPTADPEAEAAMKRDVWECGQENDYPIFAEGDTTQPAVPPTEGQD